MGYGLVIDKNNIWAVGEIHTPENDRTDSNGYWINPFNIAKWNGVKWNLLRISSKTSSGSTVEAPLTSIFAFGTDDIWFLSSAGSYVHWDGKKYNSSFIEGARGNLDKIWGTSSSDIYFSGRKGLLYHYDGINWTSLETGTEIRLLDIWGDPSGSIIWSCGYDDELGTILLKIQNKQAVIVYEDIDNWFGIRSDSLSGVLTSIWTDNPNSLFIMSHAGLYTASESTNGKAKRIWFNNYFSPGFPWRIRGSANNDILICGDFSFIAHYNGSTIYQFPSLTGRIRSWSISIKNNIYTCSGLDVESGSAIVIRGYRK